MASTVLVVGNVAPFAEARLRLTIPATNPLSIVSCTGLAEESLRVRLLSMPQQRQATAIRSAPHWKDACPCHDNTAAPARIENAPSRRRLSTFSRNTAQ